MSLFGVIHIDEKRYEELLRLGYETARKSLDEFEKRFSCKFENLKPKTGGISSDELENWRICLMVANTLKGKIN